MNAKKNIFIIDGNSMCYRAYYAIRGLSTSNGMPTNAVYGVVTMLRKIIKEHSPDAMAVVFDLPGKTERHRLYDKYKHSRPSMPDDLSSQMDKIKQVVEAYRIPVFQQEGYEADDIISTLVGSYRKKNAQVTVVTGDKDIFQLIDDNVQVLSPGPAGDKIIDVDGVIKKFGVTPDRMVDLLALVGDSSDDIPGVKGIGGVTARKLINNYGDLDSLYRQLDSVMPVSLREKLEAGKKMAYLSRTLLILKSDLKLGLGKLPVKMNDFNKKALRDIYREMEFYKLIKEMDKDNDKCESSDCRVHILSSYDEIEKILHKAAKSGRVAIRVLESKGCAVSTSPGEVYFLKFHEDKDLKKKVAVAISGITADRDILKIGHDIKEQISGFDKLGISLKPPFFDVMIAEYLIDPSLNSYSIEDISIRRFGEAVFWDSTVLDRGKGEKLMPFALLEDHDHACRVCEKVMRLHALLAKEIKEKELNALFFDVEMPLVAVLRNMEDAGVGVDTEYLRKGSDEISTRLKKISEEAYSLAGKKFNINSPRQIQQVLYTNLELPVGKKTKTGRSTDEDTLKKLSSFHPLPAKILEYRALSKLRSGYYDSILAFTDPGEKVIHARFNQAATSTGRLSSSEPNLQNIPVKKEEARRIRRAFKPARKGSNFIAADYSQVELRIMAHLSGDKGLCEAFSAGADVHSFTASRIFGCPIEEVSGEKRDIAKTVNFGVIYGMGAFGLASSLGISHDEARDFITAYFKRYSGVRDFIDNIIEKTRKDGYVTTLFKRRRYLPGILASDDRVRSFSERAAVNTAVQGTAADIIKMAMIKCAGYCSKSDAEMVIQVHDELVFEAPSGDIAAIAKDLKQIMENIVKLSVPLDVNIKIGPNWRDLENIRF